MKKLILTIALISSASAFLHAQPDPFFPKNEHYEYNSLIGIITGYAGGVGSDTCAGIRPSGKVWESGGISKDPKYEFVGWATGCAEYKPGPGITGDGTDYGASYWQEPSNAFGKATGSDTAAVVVLGDGGSITMTFANAITNGSGYDFAVFENGLSASFLEFAFVEVSTNGVDFLRFPTFYLGDKPVGSDSDNGGGANDPTKCYNLGSKYEVGWGTGYDLDELNDAYAYALAHYDFDSHTAKDDSIFSTDYLEHLLANFANVDLDEINYVRLVDIVGDGSVLDSTGTPIYDAYPTHGTPGFDLSGIGVINAVPEPAVFAAAAGLLSVFVCISRRRRR